MPDSNGRIRPVAFPAMPAWCATCKLVACVCPVVPCTRGTVSLGRGGTSPATRHCEAGCTYGCRNFGNDRPPVPAAC